MTHRALPARARLLPVLLPLVLLTGCTSDEPVGGVDASSFEGECADLSGPVTQTQEALRQVADEDITPREAAVRFRDVQDALAPVRDAAGETVQPAVVELVTRLGFYRATVDGGTYDGSQDDDVVTALEALGEACSG